MISKILKHSYVGLGYATLYRGSHVRMTVSPRYHFQATRFLVMPRHGTMLHDPEMIRVVSVDGEPWVTPELPDIPRPPAELFSDIPLSETLIFSPAAEKRIIVKKELTVEVTNDGPGDTFGVGVYGLWHVPNPCECWGAKFNPSWRHAI